MIYVIWEFILESHILASMGKLVKQGEDIFSVSSVVGVGRWWCMYFQNAHCIEKLS